MNIRYKVHINGPISIGLYNLWSRIICRSADEKINMVTFDCSSSVTGKYVSVVCDASAIGKQGCSVLAM
jgi:hypothetical protein